MPNTKSKHHAAHRSKQLRKTPNGNVELLLVQTIDHVGKQGEVVGVRPGYARNYLLPQGLATIATEHHKRMIEKHKARLMEIQKARMAGLQRQAEDISRLSVTIEANANDEGHLYGSVGAVDIVNALKRSEVTITADQVRLQGPLKELGLYTVKIHFGHEIEGDRKVWVVPTVTDEEPSKEPAKEAKE
jgi:large subunit ribosomal protein L9